MNDDVNNPGHYNVGGIEVIDVIERYAKDDFRLANVLKYVCRSGYKGNKLKDLRKAQWYLSRVIEELVALQEGADHDLVELVRDLIKGDDDNRSRMVPVIHSIEPEPIDQSVDFPDIEKGTETLESALAGTKWEPVAASWKNDEEKSCPNDIQDRVAGQTESSSDIKNKYYYREGMEVLCDDHWRGVVMRHERHGYIRVLWTHHPDGGLFQSFSTEVSPRRLSRL